MLELKNATKLGSHVGIELYRTKDNYEFYYSTKSHKTAVTFRGLSRFLECHHETIRNIAGKLNLGKELEMFTQSGIQQATLIMEDEIPLVLSAIRDSKRIKKETQIKANKFHDKLTQAGFRLMVLLEVAPEIVAKEAINKIQDKQVAKGVKQHAEQHQEYLEEFHGLQDAIKETNAHYGAINGHNNKLVGIENGKRSLMSEYQKDAMIFIQHLEKMKLKHNKEKYKNGFEATNSAKKAGTEAANLLVKTLV